MTKTPKHPSNIKTHERLIQAIDYLHAHRYGYTCPAIGLPGDPIREQYDKLFKPPARDYPHIAWGFLFSPLDRAEQHACRELALCFAAAIAEADDFWHHADPALDAEDTK